MRDELFISSNLKYLRNINSISQEKLAKVCNKGASAIGNWEAGIREPSAIDLYNISQFFSISVDDLVRKDLRFENNNKDELYILFDKYNQELTDDDKAMIKFIIEKRKKEIDEQLSSNE